MVWRVPQKLRQFESIRELQHAIAGGIDVIHREVPIDGILQLRFAEGVGNPRHLANPDGTADADDAGIHDAILGAAMMMALLPVLKFPHPTGMAIDGGQDLHQRDEIALGEVVLQGLGIALLQRGGADRKAHLFEFDVRVFPVEDVSVRGEVLPVQGLR